MQTDGPTIVLVPELWPEHASSFGALRASAEWDASYGAD